MTDQGAPAPGAASGRPREAVTPAGAHRADEVAQVEFAACYAAEMPVLSRFLMKCGASEVDAMDAAHNAFVLLYQQWGAVRKPRQWLRTVAFRIFLKMPVTGGQPLAAEHDTATALPASAPLELHEEERAVLETFLLLPLTQRAVFALYFDKFTVREIADIMQMSQDAVRQNIARARAALRELLGFT
ncbi:MAG TPA: sigma-70 family RNA polymerase sigma factor [Streptosporangiaceae bacterium]|jgi:RNA polymerase sigma-70 factor (ECF subfamily)